MTSSCKIFCLMLIKYSFVLVLRNSTVAVMQDNTGLYEIIPYRKCICLAVFKIIR